MNAIVIEHLKIAELPEAWRAKLAEVLGATVTVRIEAEALGAPQAAVLGGDDLLFGMWRNRQDMFDVADYIRSIRASRFNPDDTRR